MKNNQIIIINSCLILIVGLLSIDLYNPALPEMAKVLKVTDAQIQSLVFYYLMGFSLSQLIYGPISDKKGRVPVIIFSLTVAAIAHFLTFFAKSFSTLSILRTLTGLAAGGCPVISRAILSDTFKNKIELSKALTIFSMASQVSPAFAPIIGGYISTYLKWNYNFLVLSILISIATLFVKYTLKETNTTSKSSRNTFSNFKILLQDSKFITYSVISAILFAITIGYFTASPFIIQNEYRLSAKLNGYLFFIYSLGIVIGSFLTKKLLNYICPEKILKNSLFFLCFISASTVILNLVLDITSIICFLVYGFLIALGCGLASPLLLGLSLHSHSQISGIGSALQGTLKMAGAALSLLAFSHANTTSSTGLIIAFCLMSLICFMTIFFLQKSNI